MSEKLDPQSFFQGGLVLHQALENGVKPRQLIAWLLHIKLWADKGGEGDPPEAPLPWEMLRQYILALEGGMCQYCGLRPANTVDHILPINRGGTDDVMNLVGACRSCNASKRKKHPLQWPKSREWLLHPSNRNSRDYIIYLERISGGVELPVLR